MPVHTHEHVLRGHRGFVEGCSMSPDRCKIVSASRDCTARVWRASTGTLVLVLRGHMSWVHGAVFSPNGRVIATSSRDLTVRIWNATEGTCLLQLRGHQSDVSRCCFSSCGKWLASASNDTTVRLWSVSHGLPGKQEEDPPPMLRGHRGWVSDVSFIPGTDNRLLLSSSYDRSLWVWDVRKGHRSRQPIQRGRGGDSETARERGEKADEVWCCAMSPDGRRIAAGEYSGTVCVFSFDGGDVLATFKAHKDRVSSVVFSPCVCGKCESGGGGRCGRWLLSSSWDMSVCLWDTWNQTLVQIIRSHVNSVMQACFSSDGHQIVTAGADSTVRIFQLCCQPGSVSSLKCLSAWVVAKSRSSKDPVLAANKLAGYVSLHRERLAVIA